jgi:hypothetical protein
VSAGDVERIITAAIQNYDQQLRTANDEQSQMRDAQNASYQRAISEVPGLGDTNSDFYKTFVQVWNSSPLRQLEDGPYHVALQVQGLLANQQEANAALTQRKRQANVTTPQPTATEELGTAQVAALQKEHARLSAAIRAGSRDTDLLFKYRKINRALGRTGGRKT